MKIEQFTDRLQPGMALDGNAANFLDQRLRPEAVLWRDHQNFQGIVGNKPGSVTCRLTGLIDPPVFVRSQPHQHIAEITCMAACIEVFDEL